MTSDNWQEVGSAPKWDPRNRETGDHSLPYLLARGLLDGDVYLDSFTQEKLLDPKARDLMAKMTLGPVNGWRGLGTGRLTIRKTSGETKYWDTLGGSRDPRTEDYRRTVGMLWRGQTIYGDAANPNPTLGQLVSVGTATNALPSLMSIDPPRMVQFQVRFVF